MQLLLHTLTEKARLWFSHLVVNQAMRGLSSSSLYGAYQRWPFSNANEAFDGLNMAFREDGNNAVFLDLELAVSLPFGAGEDMLISSQFFDICY